MLNILASNIDLTEKCVFMLFILYTKAQLNLTKTSGTHFDLGKKPEHCIL
jgi:hypothetical protein